jgi:uncharacterized protein
MTNLVLDTNIWVIALSEYSEYHWLVREIVGGRISLSLTTDILLEYEEVLTRRYSASVAQTLVAALPDLPTVRLIHSYFRWRCITVDPDDNKFIDCAIAAGADALVTEDSHFAVVKSQQFPLVQVWSLEEFARVYQGAQ